MAQRKSRNVHLSDVREATLLEARPMSRCLAPIRPTNEDNVTVKNAVKNMGSCLKLQLNKA